MQRCQKMKTNLLPISKYGIKYVGCALGVFVIFSIIDLEFLALIFFAAALFFSYVFRNPERELPHFGEASVVSPVDGTVLSIEEIKDDEEYRYKVRIEGDFFTTSLLRVPMNSSLKDIFVNRGAKLSNLSSLSEKLNENAELVFEDNNLNKVKILHMSKQTFNDIHTDIIKKQKLYQGSRYGTMVNGITTMYLPENFRVNLKEGNEIKASQSLVGYFS